MADDLDSILDAAGAPAAPVAPVAEPAGPTGKFSGMLEPGNIDLAHRPQVHNPDGSISTVRSASFNFDGKEVLLPTVSDGPNARLLSDDEAVAQYKKTGKHLGKFKDPDAADAYAEALHQQQAKFYKVGGPSAPSGPAPSSDDLDAALNVAQPGKAEAQQAAQPSTFDSLWSAAKGAAGGAWDATKAIGHGLKQANDAVANAIVHPVDTFNAVKANPGAYGREAMRGVNDNIPFANTAVEKMGGPAAESPEDAAAAPGVRQVGGLAGAPVGGEMVGGLAAKGLETLAPAASSFVRSFGKAAEERQTTRALEDLQVGARQKSRLGLEVDAGDGAAEAVVAGHPELRKAVGHDAQLVRATTAIKQKAGAELQQIYGEAHVDPAALAAPIENMDARIDKLNALDTSEGRAAAKALKKIRDEMNAGTSVEGFNSPAKLREQQSAYQRASYGKVLPGTPGAEEATANLWANAEASKAVGDAVLKHVTGMDYAGAKAAAEANPNSLAGRIFKANEEIEGANRIEATVSDRMKSGKAAEPHGIGGVAKKIVGHAVKHAVLPAVVGMATHDPFMALQAAGISEGVQSLPAIARGAAKAKDALTVGASGLAAPALDTAGRTAGAYGRALEIPRDATLAKKIQELMKRGIPQATAVQMARGTPGAAAAFEPSMAQNPDAQPIVL
jgi:hypothetical protein